MFCDTPINVFCDTPSVESVWFEAAISQCNVVIDSNCSHAGANYELTANCLSDRQHTREMNTVICTNTPRYKGQMRSDYKSISKKEVFDVVCDLLL